MGQSCCRAAAPCEEVLHETTEACDSEAESLLRELFRSYPRCMGELHTFHSDTSLGGLAGQNCHCQWGLSGILLGIVVMLAAGVFTALPVYFDLFCYQWYYALCWMWFAIGAFMLVFGIVYEDAFAIASPQVSSLAKSR
eukprot:s6135_g6.t1